MKEEIIECPPRVKAHFRRTALRACNNIDKKAGHGNKFFYQQHQGDVNTIAMALMNKSFEDDDEHGMRCHSVIARLIDYPSLQFEIAGWIAKGFYRYVPLKERQVNC